LANLDKIIVIAKTDSQILEEVIKSYTPFILASASRVLSKSVNIHDDEASIAMLAFAEAVKSYEKEKGHFIIFAKKVIRFRLIDYLRKNARYNSEIVFSSIIITGESIDSIENFSPVDESTIEDPVRLEIEVLSEELKLYGFEFIDLVKASPTAKKTREICSAAVTYILNNPELVLKIKMTRKLPINEISLAQGISKKTLERHRKYIIAAMEILTNDLNYLGEYLPHIKEG